MGSGVSLSPWTPQTLTLSASPNGEVSGPANKAVCKKFRFLLLTKSEVKYMQFINCFWLLPLIRNAEFQHYLISSLSVR